MTPHAGLFLTLGKKLTIFVEVSYAILHKRTGTLSAMLINSLCDYNLNPCNGLTLTIHYMVIYYMWYIVVYDNQSKKGIGSYQQVNRELDL